MKQLNSMPSPILAMYNIQQYVKAFIRGSVVITAPPTIKLPEERFGCTDEMEYNDQQTESAITYEIRDIINVITASKRNRRLSL